MWTIRPVADHDLDQLMALAAAIGSGMTTFPTDRDTMARKVATSVRSFAGKVERQDGEYLMVLEDLESGALLGTSAVYASIGKPFGFFSYHVDRLVQHSPQLDFHLDCSILNLSNAYTGLSEIGTLAVSPKARGGGAGKILARARYLLMATFPHLFADRVIAEMRGWQEEEGRSPFWSAVGERFFRMDFPTADRISAIQGAEWIANLMPKFPIYLELLPRGARESVGRPHQTSAIAMKMLEEEGFGYENYVDVFDAGPQVVARRDRIWTVAESAVARVQPGEPSESDAVYLVSNLDLASFRVFQTNAFVRDDTVTLASADLDRLGVHPGAVVRFVPAVRPASQG